MRRSIVFAVVFISAFLAIPSVAAMPPYDRSTEVTLEGTALFVGEEPLGVYVIMKDRAEQSGQINEIMVHLAPQHFLASEGIEIVTGDKIKIVGSRVNDGCETILAREVTKNGKTVALRDKSGTPLR